MKKQLLMILFACICVTALQAQSSWSVQQSGTFYTLKGVDFIDENIGIAVGDTGVIVRTINGGQTWEILNSGVTLCLNSVSFIDANNIIVVGNNALILKSTDGGDSWVAQYIEGTGNGGSVNADFWSVDMSSSGKGIVVGQYQTLVTTTDGFVNKLIIRKNYSGGFYSASILDEDNAFVFGINGNYIPIVYKVAHFDSLSTARYYLPFDGTIYTEVATLHDGFAFSTDSVLTVGNMEDPNALYGMSSYICRNQSWETDEWNTVYTVYDCWYNAVDFVNNYGVSVGGKIDPLGINTNIISESSDQGRTWKEVQSPIAHLILNDVKILNTAGYIVGDSGLIIKTELPAVNYQSQQIDYSLNVYPNPSGDHCNISFLNPAKEDIEISLYNSNGKLVSTVFKGILPSGKHEFRLSFNKLSNGFYYCTLRAGKQAISKKISIVR